jgi:hypothetical protein
LIIVLPTTCLGKRVQIWNVDRKQHVGFSNDMNDVEELFNQFKHYIRRKKPQNLSELKDAVNFSLNEIKKRGCCTNYFVHAYKEKRVVERKHKLRPKKKYKNR